MIVGTAGHIDHGKTALVRALTGVDTDRLPEEKRRGITIELGFAPLPLGDGLNVGMVDVPGHESFVRTMVAGATGIDVALIVVAANEGVMPQTREHVAILDLLGVADAIVAITKADLVDESTLARTEGEVRSLLSHTGLKGAELIPVSVVTGLGVDRVRAALREFAQRSTAESGSDLVRLPIDRVFTMPGAGTIVTGTLWSGALSVGDGVIVLPSHERARIRAIETHSRRVDRVESGARTAIALPGLPLERIHRGHTIVTSDAWRAVSMIRADVTLLADAAPIGTRTRVRVHLATSDVGGRVVADGKALKNGVATPVRVLLDDPLIARGGDRFVLRRGAPIGTIGGGIVTDAAPEQRRARAFAKAGMKSEERFAAIVSESGLRGADEDSLTVRLGLSPVHLARLLEQGGYARIGSRLYLRSAVADLESNIVAWLDHYHRTHPQIAGAPLEDLRVAMTADPAIVDHAIASLVTSKGASIDGSRVRRATWSPARDTVGDARREDLLRRLREAASAPPSVAELEKTVGYPVIPFLRALEREGKVVALALDRFASAESAQQLWQAVSRRLDPAKLYRPSDLRAVFGVSRQYLIPWLEYFDRQGWSHRDGDGRRFRIRG